MLAIWREHRAPNLVGREQRAPKIAGVALQGGQQLAARGIPHSRRVVLSGHLLASGLQIRGSECDSGRLTLTKRVHSNEQGQGR